MVEPDPLSTRPPTATTTPTACRTSPRPSSKSSVVPVLSKAFIPKALPPTEPAKHLKHNSTRSRSSTSCRARAGPSSSGPTSCSPTRPTSSTPTGNYIQSPQHAGISDTEAWKGQLEYTNKWLETFLEGLLSKPEAEQPIIVLQADEGPWPDAYTRDKVGFNWATASADQLEMKFGILNAWYVPGGTQGLGLRQDQTAINTFPTLFDKYFGLDVPGWRTRVQRGRQEPAVRRTEITDRLRSSGN